ncbi:hypothetical protein CVT24_002808 [Panaeolus cyanescens]|uniref:Uncharacterized protein n=1 Tax=Panaeolus cyanescens TaxID=181874 RepID=A0A409X211_9AGAR|nr:hypothetical protein CVT24_002808 [Panaeolus cyanescens]
MSDNCRKDVNGITRSWITPHFSPYSRAQVYSVSSPGAGTSTFKKPAAKARTPIADDSEPPCTCDRNPNTPPGAPPLEPVFPRHDKHGKKRAIPFYCELHPKLKTSKPTTTSYVSGKAGVITKPPAPIAAMVIDIPDADTGPRPYRSLPDLQRPGATYQGPDRDSVTREGGLMITWRRREPVDIDMSGGREVERHGGGAGAGTGDRNRVSVAITSANGNNRGSGSGGRSSGRPNASRPSTRESDYSYTRPTPVRSSTAPLRPPPQARVRSSGTQGRNRRSNTGLAEVRPLNTYEMRNMRRSGSGDSSRNSSPISRSNTTTPQSRSTAPTSVISEGMSDDYHRFIKGSTQRDANGWRTQLDSEGRRMRLCRKKCCYRRNGYTESEMDVELNFKYDQRAIDGHRSVGVGMFRVFPDEFKKVTMEDCVCGTCWFVMECLFGSGGEDPEDCEMEYPWGR